MSHSHSHSSSSSSSVPPQAVPSSTAGKKVYTIHGTKFEVDNKYNVHKAVGYGAYGFVCAATNSETGEKVAIKKIPKVFQDLVDGKRILREIKLLNHVAHENVISIRDLLRPAQKKDFQDIYIVSDLMDTDLHQVIRSRQKLSEEHWQYFIYQILRGLKYIHSASILHRDLKPGNLLVNANCDLRICDFGLARGFDPNDCLAELTDYVVTRWYRPPELLLQQNEYTKAIDMWSVGCISAELINRRPLFPGRDYIHQLQLIVDLLGHPSEEEQHFIKNDEALRFLKSLPKKKAQPLKKAFPTVTNPQALDFLQGLLQFDPKKRLTAEQALEHPYLAHLHDAKDEPTANSKFHWSKDSDDLTEDQLRNLLWEEIIKFHPDQ